MNKTSANEKIRRANELRRTTEDRRAPTQIPITFSDKDMPFGSSMIVEVEPPSPMRYLIGAAIMMIGVVFPVGYMMFRNKRVPSYSSPVVAAAAVGSSSSGYSKLT